MISTYPNLQKISDYCVTDGNYYVADIIFVHTWTGGKTHTYLKQTFTHAINKSSHLGAFPDAWYWLYCTEPIIPAIWMANKNRPCTEGMIFHSDREIQYDCKQIVNLLKS